VGRRVGLRHLFEEKRGTCRPAAERAAREAATRVDDLRYKQELCAYLRKQVGMFGSEEGREWGIPQADYFEGLLGHRTRYQRPNDNDIVIPLFQLVYNDAMPVYYFPGHRYLTPDRKVETTRFGGDLQVTVNYGAADFRMKNAVLPQYGFLIESPKLVAFHATSYGGTTWSEPTLLVAHVLDGRLRTYRAFGDHSAEKVRPAR
jgi:hypothetical protein